MMRVSFRRVAVTVLGLYFLVTCYTGYMVIRKKLERTQENRAVNKNLKAPSDDAEWNPWGQEFEHENEALPDFERPHLILESHGPGGPTPTAARQQGGWPSRPAESTNLTAKHVVEIWGKAAIGLYLWEHIFGATLTPKLGGIWSYGTQQVDNILFRFRTGPGVVPGKVPHDLRHLVLVVNGREPSKVETARMWLDYLPNMPLLRSVALVMLGNERCNNSWLHPYLASNGGQVKVVFLVYDSAEVDDEQFFQWPLGVATYRGFPLVRVEEVSAEARRPYLCNFLGTVYRNSSRESLLNTLDRSPWHSSCYIHPRKEWQPSETSETRADYLRALRQSDLTLSPVGVNTECYRLYEALSLGSVPVVEDVMTPGLCGGPGRAALRLLKAFKAPLLYVRDWSQLDAVLERERRRPFEDVVKRRQEALQWYSHFRWRMRERFVDVLRRKFFPLTEGDVR